MPDIPAWWAQQNQETKAITIVVGLIAFILALALLPPLLILAGVGLIGYGLIAHIYEVTVKEGSWTNPESMYVFSCITGVVVLLCGGVLTWVF